MKRQNLWFLVPVLVLLLIILPIYVFFPRTSSQQQDPWSFLPDHPQHTDHSELMSGPYKEGSDVTKTCLGCHQEAATQVMNNAHWKWESEPVKHSDREEPIVLGKKNAINNFCIGIRSNWPPCTACHVGYGWVDETFDFSDSLAIDCIVCHDQSGQYVKTKGGYPAKGVDLAMAAQSVGVPTRENCGGCHFRGGGGNAVKHGDLDESLYYPSERIDIHMGKHAFICTDCHRTTDHNIKGRSISVSPTDKNQIYCTDCHTENVHRDERLNQHVTSVACQTCHIPEGAVKEATKMHWDWSAAGQDLPEDPHEYLKIKGRFVYERNITPDYFWYNGKAIHYIFGDPIDPSNVTLLNEPRGSKDDPDSKIWPFKVHLARQIYDTEYNILLQPKTYGKGGFWSEFDWDKAAKLGSEAIGLPYSGHYGFTSTAMFWPITHMVAPTSKSLQCNDCHDEHGEQRLNWNALGYEGDPMLYGGRFK
jgi:octaheme c-type cytochrome (tetrathionate reductase family)